MTAKVNSYFVQLASSTASTHCPHQHKSVNRVIHVGLIRLKYVAQLIVYSEITVRIIRPGRLSQHFLSSFSRPAHLFSLFRGTILQILLDPLTNGLTSLLGTPTHAVLPTSSTYANIVSAGTFTAT